MNYTFMPSLEHRALIKTVITLWISDDIQLDDIEWKDKKWVAEDRVIGKVKELPLPESLKKKISSFIKPIGFEILKWINHYQNILSVSEIEVWPRTSLVVDVKEVGESLGKLCWTPQGTVDRKKTVEELIRDDQNLFFRDRYKLACIYCLRKAILKLWSKMSEYCRKSFYSEEDPRYVEQNKLVVFWTYDIKGELNRMNNIFEYSWTYSTPYEYAFLHAVRDRNKVATEYFWQTLTFEKREEFFLRAASIICFTLKEDDGDILYFLLSQMNGEQQLKVFKKHPCEVLKCLLYWPWQDFFMETANHVWEFLSIDKFCHLLELIISKNAIYGYMDYDYKKLFRDFWQQSPIMYKTNLLDKDATESLMLLLLKIEDKEYFKIIFPSILDREKMLFSDHGKRLWENLIFYNKTDLLEVFVQECTSSKDVIIKFREEIEKHLMHRNSNTNKTFEEKKFKLSKLFQLLDELIQKDDKRKSMDERNTDPAKRLCSLTNE